MARKRRSDPSPQPCQPPLPKPTPYTNFMLFVLCLLVVAWTVGRCSGH